VVYSSILNQILEITQNYHRPIIGKESELVDTLEWIGENSKRICLFVDENNNIEYLKTWGFHIVNDMEDGKINNLNEILNLLDWLYK
jgi:hypothetical protein